MRGDCRAAQSRAPGCAAGEIDVAANAVRPADYDHSLPRPFLCIVLCLHELFIADRKTPLRPNRDATLSRPQPPPNPPIYAIYLTKSLLAIFHHTSSPSTALQWLLRPRTRAELLLTEQQLVTRGLLVRPRCLRLSIDEMARDVFAVAPKSETTS